MSFQTTCVSKRLLRNVGVFHLKSHSKGQILAFEKQSFSEI